MIRQDAKMINDIVNRIDSGVEKKEVTKLLLAILPLMGMDKDHEKIIYPDGVIRSDLYSLVKYTLSKGSVSVLKPSVVMIREAPKNRTGIVVQIGKLAIHLAFIICNRKSVR